MPYAPSPAIPPGMSPRAWLTAVNAIAKESSQLAARLAAGKPMGRGMAARIRSLEATALALRELAPPGMTPDQLRVATYAMDGMADIFRASHAQVTAALPAHALAASQDLATWAASQGMHPVVNVNALQAMAARTQMAMTHDWSRLTADSAQRIIDGVAQGMVAGLNPREVARKIRGTITETGAMSYARAMNIASTEMADLYDSSRLHTMSSTPEIGGWWWRARPDACSICQIKHGMVHLSNEPTHRHHQCRCIMVPIPGEPPGPPGSYMPDMQRSPSQVYAQLPPGLQKHVNGAGGKDAYDYRELLALRDNKGWRQSLDVQPPGKGQPWMPGTGYGGSPLAPGAPAQVRPAS